MAIIDRTNWAQVQREFRQAEELLRHKEIVFLTEVGEGAVKYARENSAHLKTYTDRTGNLRHSIGYLVIQNGEVKVDAFGTTEPQQIARQYAYQVAKDYPKGTVLIWVAGMEYASFVEAKGFDVLEGSGIDVESKVQGLMQRFEQYLLK